MKKLTLIFVILLTSNLGWGALPPKDLPPAPSLLADHQSAHEYFNRYSDQCSGSNCQAWVSYKLGQLWNKISNEQSCLYFTEVGNAGLPISPLALVRASQTCAPTKPLLDKLVKLGLNEEVSRWQKSLFLRSAAQIAEQLQMKEFVQLAAQVAEISRSRRTKTKWIKAALGSKQLDSEEKIHELRQKLYKVAPRLNPNPDNWYEVGVDAYKAHEFPLAIKAFKKSLRSSKTKLLERRNAINRIRLSLKITHRKEEAVRYARKLWKFDQKRLKRAAKRRKYYWARKLLDSTIMLARSQWTLHRPTQAKKIIKKGRKLLKRYVPVDQIDYLETRINLESGDSGRSIASLQKTAAKTKNRHLRGSIQWSLAWTFFKKGQLTKAKNLLEEFLSDEKNQAGRTKAHFWLGKTFRRLKKEDKAKEQFKQVIEDEPISYYALLAYRELGLQVPRPQTTPNENSKIPRKMQVASTADEPHNLFQWLVAVDEFKWAQNALKDFAPLPHPGSQEWFPSFQRYALAHYYSPLFRRVSLLSGPEKQKVLSEAPDMVYPRAYSQIVVEASLTSGLWPEYIFAIIRQESAFNPRALSNADAYGLMQVLPTVAKKIIKKDDSFDLNSEDLPEALYQPDINVMLGASHLRNYWDRFDGQFILATAAYNAGPAPVRSWVRTRYKGDPIQFIEDIPYNETQKYVKLVLRNFINYQRLNASTTSIPFPEWTLEGI